ncbi:hypothetical protein [Streptomyces sp. NPDC006658]|uniref:hypothetical protein n=1 Tax=Streptomyces sp. NPDC006658 TaxID=3156900 RepID=UPI0033F6EC08
MRHPPRSVLATVAGQWTKDFQGPVRTRSGRATGPAALRPDGAGRRPPGSHRSGGAACRDDLGQWNTREPTDPAGGLPAARPASACDGTPAAYGAGPRDHPRAVHP